MDGPHASQLRRHAPLWALAALLLGFALHGVATALLANDPRFQDTEPFLGHALYVADHGGPIAAIADAYRGAFPIVERHLLYPLLLAPFAARTPQFFLDAKLLNLGLGVAVLLSLWWISRDRFGVRVALLATALYACTSTLIIASSRVAQENLFVLCVLWAFHFLTRRRSTPTSARTVTLADEEVASRSGGPPCAPPALLDWTIAGGLLGLAWLAKSSAALLGVGLALAAVAHFGPRIALERRAWALVLCGLVLVSPLLVRNMVAFGTPVYEGMNGHIMWMDDWSELGDPGSILYYDQYGITHIERNALPSAARYAESHDLADAATRLAHGLELQGARVIPTALAPPAPMPAPVRRAWGYAIFALAMAGVWRLRHRWIGRLVLAWSGAFVLFFGWNTLFPEPRYLAPLVPLWTMLAATVLSATITRLVPERARDALVAALVALVALLGATRAATAGVLATRPPLIQASPAAWRLLRWIDSDAQPGARLMIGPTREFFGLLWLTDTPVQIVQTPRVDALPQFLDYLRERRVDYLVIHPENVGGEKGRLATALAPYVASVPGGVVGLQDLPEWTLFASDSGDPPRYLVYRTAARTPLAPARTVALATGAHSR